MIKARHTVLGAMVAELYSGFGLNRAFRQTEYTGEWIDNGLPILMLSNHFCWWDGFIQYRLNRKVFHRKLYVMMLDEQLRQNMILNQCGCFSVKKNSRNIIESLNYGKEILSNSGNLLLIFPQGEIQSMHTESIKFGSGPGFLLKELGSRVNIVFNVNLVDYFSKRKPAMSIYFKALSSDLFVDTPTLEKQYNQFYTRCIEQQNLKR